MSDVTIVDGVLRAMVVTTHTMRAATLPRRMLVLHPDIMQRTLLGAPSATNTLIRHPEMPVGDDKVIKQRLQYIGLG